jgi:hypothetical protein
VVVGGDGSKDSGARWIAATKHVGTCGGGDRDG